MVTRDRYSFKSYIGNFIFESILAKDFSNRIQLGNEEFKFDKLESIRYREKRIIVLIKIIPHKGYNLEKYCIRLEFPKTSLSLPKSLGLFLDDLLYATHEKLHIERLYNYSWSGKIERDFIIDFGSYKDNLSHKYDMDKMDGESDEDSEEESEEENDNAFSMRL